MGGVLFEGAFEGAGGRVILGISFSDHGWEENRGWGGEDVLVYVVEHHEVTNVFVPVEFSASEPAGTLAL